MRKEACAVALVSLTFAGCAEKSDEQQVTDAIKAKIAERGKPTQITCKPEIRLGWSCLATLHHKRTRHAVCVALDEPKGPGYFG